jgi:hypothetical protein
MLTRRTNIHFVPTACPIIGADHRTLDIACADLQTPRHPGQLVAWMAVRVGLLGITKRG